MTARARRRRRATADARSRIAGSDQCRHVGTARYDAVCATRRQEQVHAGRDASAVAATTPPRVGPASVSAVSMAHARCMQPINQTRP